MSAVSPATNTGLQVTATITVDGKVFDSDRIVSIETWSAANKIPRARIVINDGEPDTADFPLSDSKTFLPGAKVEVAAGYGPTLAVIHSGVIVRHSIRIQPEAAAQLIVETADPLIKMTLGRNNAISAKSSDQALIAKLVKDNGGTVGTNKASGDPIEAFVQYDATDWDLLLVRAEANGCVVLVEASKASIVSPADTHPPVLTAAYGESIIAFEATVDAADEYKAAAINSRSWSYQTQKLSEAKAASVSVTAPGNLTAAKLAGVLGVDPVLQQSGAAVTEKQLAAWSTARLMRSELARVQGSARFQGTPLAKPGCFVTLAGVGDRFNGDAFVSGAQHRIADGAWTTIIQFGMAPESFASQNDIGGPPAAGLAAPVRGLQTGLVKQVATDPNGDFRVLVTLPLTASPDGIWARLGQLYASKGFGACFFPEVGDEVVLGFMDDDPANPVVLASLYSSTRAPAAPPNDANDIKALVTRKELQIKFDDKDAILTITTKDGCSIVLDDKNKQIKIADSNSNSLTMSKGGIDIISGAGLTLKAKQDVTIESGTNLTVKGGTKLAMSAPEVEAKAGASLKLGSDAMGELKAGAVQTIGGALVKIN